MIDAPHDEPLRDEPTPDEAGAAEPSDAQAEASEIAQLRAESAQRLAAWQRAQADYENLKRRSAQDVRDRVERSQRAIFETLIDLADDFHRALEAEPGGEDGLREGVRLIEQKLLSLLERNEIRPIAAARQPFDHDFHEAMGELPGPKNEVVAEIRRGWLIGSRVLRASLVMVGAGQPDEPDVSAAASGKTPTPAPNSAPHPEGDEPCRE